MTTPTWIRGDTNRIEVTVTDGGAPVVLDGATIEAAIVQTIGQAPLVEKTTADFTVVGNVATCVLTIADTQTLEAGAYFIEVEITDGDGQRQSAQAPILIENDSVSN